MKNEQIKRAQTLVELLQQLEAQGATPVVRAIETENFLREKAWETGTPMSGKFELTPLCNLSCKMCYVHLSAEQFRGAELLSIEKWKHLMKQAADAGMLIATLTGGECLTYTGFEELYLYLHELGIQVVVMSNGVLMNQEKIEFFKIHPPKMIQISLYGSCEEAYERVTGFRSFQAVMDTIQRVKTAEIPLALAITPNKFMEEDGEALIRLAASLDVPFNISPSLFDPYEETGRKGDNLDLYADGYLKLYKLQAALEGRILTPGSVEKIPMPEKIETSARGLHCGAGRSGFTITWDGRLQPCSMLRDIQQFPLEVGFEIAWKNIHQIAVNYPCPEECEECRYRPLCKQCVAEHAQAAAMGHYNPAVCKRTKQLVAEGIIAPLIC